MRRESLLVGCALIGTLTLFSGCRTAQKSNEKQILTKIESNADESASENKTSKQNVLGEPTGSMALSYAENFSVDYYGDYTLLKTKDGTQILTVPEDKDIPDNCCTEAASGWNLSGFISCYGYVSRARCAGLHPIFWPEGRKLVY